MLRLLLKIIPLPLQILSLRLLLARSINKNQKMSEILMRLEGKEISIYLTDIRMGYTLSVKDHLLQVDKKEAKNPDVAIKGDTDTFFGLIKGRLDPDSVFFNRTLRVEGDVGTLVLFKNLLESVK